MGMGDSFPETQIPLFGWLSRESAGSAWNVGSGSITRMKTYINGVDAVTNEADWITVVGADEEEDEALRHRCYLVWEELARGGTAAAYVSWALSVTGVTSAFVDDDLPRGEGTLDLYIMGEAGAPDGALIEAVQAVVDGSCPITADALVRVPDAINVPIHLVVTPRAGYDPSALDTEIRRRLSVLFGDIDDPSLGLSPPGRRKRRRGRSARGAGDGHLRRLLRDGPRSSGRRGRRLQPGARARRRDDRHGDALL